MFIVPFSDINLLGKSKKKILHVCAVRKVWELIWGRKLGERQSQRAKPVLKPVFALGYLFILDGLACSLNGHICEKQKIKFRTNVWGLIGDPFPICAVTHTQ